MEPIDYNSQDPTNDPFAGKAYAGFWWRFLAWLIDMVLLWIVQQGIILAAGAAGYALEPSEAEVQMLTERLMEDRDFLGFYGDLFAMQVPLMVISTVVNLLYFVLMEASPKQGTLGKMALGITVTDTKGQRISFLRALGRFFAKYVSALTLFIGYIMAGFTEKKQALHDMIAGTLVMKKQ